MADGNGVGTNPDFFDQEAHDFLLLDDVERLGARAQSGAELRERLTQPQIAGLIDRRRLDRLLLRRDRLLLRPEGRHPRAQVLQRYQLVLVGRDQAVQGRRHTDLLPREVVGPLPRGIGLSRRLSPPRQFRFD